MSVHKLYTRYKIIDFNNELNNIFYIFIVYNLLSNYFVNLKLSNNYYLMYLRDLSNYKAEEIISLFS